MKKLQIDLITGFLGSGKTTFIRHYAQYLFRQGQRIAIVENDYGAINVDRMLLSDLDSDRCDVEMVIGGDADCHRRRLHAKLVTLRMLGYERIVMEPSGIFDVDEFLDLLKESPLEDWYEIGNIIAVVKADLEENLSEESEYLLAAQTADAGMLVLSRVQDVSQAQVQKTLSHVNEALRRFRCKRRFSTELTAAGAVAASAAAGTTVTAIAPDVIMKNWDMLTDQEFEQIFHAGCRIEPHIKYPVTEENAYDSLFYMYVKIRGKSEGGANRESAEGTGRASIEASMDRIMADVHCGNIIRIKGFLQDAQGQWYEINVTPQIKNIFPRDNVPKGSEVVIVIGEKLNRERVGTYFTYTFGSGKEMLSGESE